MRHPQPPFGAQDPNQQPSEPPTQAFPTAPMPPVSGAPYPPPVLPAGNDLAAGSKRSGTVIFDVKDRNGTLEYEHRFKAAGSWKP